MLETGSEGEETIVIVNEDATLLHFFACLSGLDWDNILVSCIPDYPETHYVTQADLKFNDPPVSAFQMLELRAWAPSSGWKFLMLFYIL